MRKLTGLLLSTLMLGCAHAKMGAVEAPLESGSITKDTKIYVLPVTTDNLVVTGDKAKDEARISEEKTIIEGRFAKMIVDQLIKKGYKAELVTGSQKKGVVITGHVTRFEHGSGAARMWVGMGAGSSNLFTDFKIEDRSKGSTLSKFEVIATSGGRGGLAATGSFMDAHLEDGSKKVAEYVSGQVKK